MRPFIISFLCLFAVTTNASAFCGFYVAKADGQLFNEASKVVYTRHKNRSTITMSSDYSGEPKDFAMIVPTPRVLKRDEIRTVKSATLDHIDAYTAPRLVEYFDDDPCAPKILYEMAMELSGSGPRKNKIQRSRGAAAKGVTIKAEYAVGIYDILILKAKQSNGLVSWLKSEDYNIPNGAEKALGGYIDMGMKFFVARVNLARQAKSAKTELEPLQISFRSNDFMLPIQLGKVNSAGTQDVLLYTLTKDGRVEPTNYAAERIPSNMNIPSFVENMFGNFYKAVFSKSVGNSGIVTEYAWDMAWCDPCAADPLSFEELRELGVTWAKSDNPNAGQDVFVTRLHMRYDKDTMTKDPMFKITKDRSNFQGRYVMNQPFTGKITCAEGNEYVKEKREEIRKEAKELAKLTGWSPRKIDQQIAKTIPAKFR